MVVYALMICCGTCTAIFSAGPSMATMLPIAQEVISKGLSVRELESLVKMRRVRTPKRRMRPAQRDHYLSALEEELQQVLATKVRISKRKKRGHILIEFYSPEDLERIVHRFTKG